MIIPPPNQKFVTVAISVRFQWGSLGGVIGARLCSGFKKFNVPSKIKFRKLIEFFKYVGWWGGLLILAHETT